MSPDHPSIPHYEPFRLVEVRVGRRGGLWTVQFGRDESTRSDFDRFLTDAKIQEHRHFIPLSLLLDDMVENTGYQPEDFKHDGYLDDVTGYVRPPEHRHNLELRLYCARLSRQLLIVGAGCIKRGGGRAEFHRNCNGPLKRMEHVYLRVKESIDAGQTGYTDKGRRFAGKIYFED